MTNMSERETKEITVADLFPGLSENELKDVQEALEAYCSIALQIFTRLEREHGSPFDCLTEGS